MTGIRTEALRALESGEYLWTEEEGFGNGATITSETGEKEVLSAALNKRMPKGSLADQIVPNATGEETLVQALNKRTVVINSVSDLQTGSFPGADFLIISGYYGNDTLGGGLVYRDTEDTTSSDNGGSVFVDDDDIRWKRRNKGYVDVSEWGVSSDLNDNTSRYAAIISDTEEGSTIKWPDKGTFTGNFLSNKTFKLELGDATYVNFSDSDPLFSMQGSEVPQTVVVGTLTYGDRSIEVSDATGISEGSIIRVFDEKVRPTDGTPEINSEVFRVSDVSSNTLTIEDMVRSEQNSGTINVMLISALQYPSVVGGKFEPTSSHSSRVVSIWYGEGVLCSSFGSEGFDTRVVDVRGSIDVTVNDIKCRKPKDTSSGKGYGVGFVNCRDVDTRNIKSWDCRHTVDYNSCYNCETHDITEYESFQAAVVTLAHNSFGGNHRCSKVRATGNMSSCINWSGSGVTDLDELTVRDISIKDISIVNYKDFGTSYTGVGLQASVSGVLVENVRLETTGSGSGLNGTLPTIVRLYGDCHGSGLTVRGVYSKNTGVAVRCENDAGAGGVGVIDISSVHLETCYRGIWIRGYRNFTAGNITSDNTGQQLITVEDFNGVTILRDTRWGLTVGDL